MISVLIPGEASIRFCCRSIFKLHTFYEVTQDLVFTDAIMFMTLLTAVLLQVLSNLANDYGDSINGADHAEREGPSRAVQSGAISMQTMRFAVIVFVILSFVSGISLLYVSFGWHWKSILFFLGLGVLSILCISGSRCSFPAAIPNCATAILRAVWFSSMKIPIV